MITTIGRHVSGARAETVLVVGGDDLVRESGAALHAEGLRMVSASSCEAALRQLDDVDVVLIDAAFAERAGWEVCEQIKRCRDDVPVIVVTAGSRPPVIVRLFECGADDYIIRPFHAIELLTRLRSRLELRRARAEERESKAWLTALLTSASDAIVVRDVDHRYVAAYGSWFSRHEYPKEDLIGRAPSDVFCPALSAVHEQASRRALGGDTFVYEWQLPLNGSIAHFHSSIGPIRNARGEIAGSISVGRDITPARAAAEAAYRQAMLFAAVTDAVIIADADHRIVDWNAAAETVFGYTREEVLGRGPHEFLDSPAEFLGLLNSGLSESDHWQGELILRHKSGREVPCEVAVHCLRDEQERLIGTIGINRDVTSRREAESAIRKREAVLMAVGEAAQRMLRTVQWTAEIDPLLCRLGEVTESDRVYLFENCGNDGELRLRQRFEWAAPGVKPEIDREEYRGLTLDPAVFGALTAGIQSRVNFQTHVRDLPAAGQLILERGSVRSLAVVPIFAGEVWWGFLGLDACRAERTWSPGEMEALRTAAELIGAGIQRATAESALHESEEQFRLIADMIPQLVWMTTPDGYHEYFGSSLF